MNIVEINKIRDEKLSDLEKRRNKNLDNKLFETKEAILVHIDKRIKEIPAHRPSAETLDKIRVLEETNIVQNEHLAKIASQVDAMYTVFTSTNFILKFTIKLFGAIGIITGGIIGCIELMKRSK